MLLGALIGGIVGVLGGWAFWASVATSMGSQGLKDYVSGLYMFAIFGALAGSTMGLSLAALGVAARETFRSARGQAASASEGSTGTAGKPSESDVDPVWTWLTGVKHTLLWAACALYGFLVLCTMFSATSYQRSSDMRFLTALMEKARRSAEEHARLRRRPSEAIPAAPPHARGDELSPG